MRGKPWAAPRLACYQRNIPAYAGKTWRGSRRTPYASEHPRVCGENQNWIDLELIPYGTSPRMRGKPPGGGSLPGGCGNIPAYAGKTSTGSEYSPWGTEHPRVCGENRCYSPTTMIAIGTSPRMRGKLINVGCGSPFDRNIPAYAGKTVSSKGFIRSFPEHPRVCGENEWACASPITQTGTSPRMRGKHR